MTVDAAYRDCRRIAARHGRTYYLATRLLPLQRRPGIHALYAFARQVDDVVDVATGKRPWADVAADLDRVQARLEHPAAGADLAPSWDPVFVALRDTIARYDIPLDYFRAFLDSMRMDVPGTELYRNRYPTMTDLRRYTYGSAAVIGLQVLPILGTVVPLDRRGHRRPRSARRSSSRTSCATSARISTATASTCPPTNSPRSASPRTCCATGAAAAPPTAGCARRSRTWSR